MHQRDEPIVKYSKDTFSVRDQQALLGQRAAHQVLAVAVQLDAALRLLPGVAPGPVAHGQEPAHDHGRSSATRTRMPADPSPTGAMPATQPAARARMWPP